MKLNVQTLKNTKYAFEAEETDTIEQMKQKLNEQFQLGEPIDTKLIYMGRILKNEDTVKQTQLKENDIMVLMVSKKRTTTTAATATIAPIAPSYHEQKQEQEQERESPPSERQAQIQPQQTEDTTTTTTTTANSTPNPMIQMLLSDPSFLPILMQQINRESPETAQIIAQNPQLLMQLLQTTIPSLNRGGSGSGGDENADINGDRDGDVDGDNDFNFHQVAAQQGMHVTINTAEQTQVRNLETLGFNHQRALEAFLLCDRNEELAANYLFDHGNDV